MNDTPTALQSAEQRVADKRAVLLLRLDALEAKARRVATSPRVIGGVIAATAAAAATAYLLLAHRSKPRPPAPRPRSGNRVLTVLKAAQVLIALSGTVAAGLNATPKPVRPTRPSDTPTAAGTAAPADPAPARPSAAGTPPGRQWPMIKATVTAWVGDDAPSMGAALSYYTLFSLAPLLIIVIAVAGMVFGQAAAQGEIVGQLRGTLGQGGAVAVEGLLAAAREPAKGLFATVVSVVMLLIGATAVFAELQSALDRIWRVPAPAGPSGLWNLARTRLLSFGLMLGLGLLLAVSLVLSAAVAALGTWWGGWLQGWDAVLEALNFAVSFSLFTLLFAMIYKTMPRARISWRDVWTGAAVTALLFTVGKLLIGLYLGTSNLASGFGAAGSLVVLIAWVYYSAQIFLLGAEYTWVYANTLGSRAARKLPIR
jgi:YihY family inner membrane protein